MRHFGWILVLALQACSDAPLGGAADSVVTDSQAASPATCPTGPWLAVQVGAGRQVTDTCAPDLPVWGAQPDSPPPLGDPGDGTLVDAATRLQWQAKPTLAMVDQDAAVAHCRALVLAGSADWRLPTAAELATLVDYGRPPPAMASPLDDHQGGRTDWTLSRLGAMGWIVDFGTGQTRPAVPVELHGARCVRLAGASWHPVPDRFTHQGNDTVRDHLLGLEWLRDLPVNTYRALDALGWCAQLDHHGHGWRLPTARELASLLDRSAPSPHVDHAVFFDAVNWCWTLAFVWGDSALFVWAVDFADGSIVAREANAYGSVICVRALP